MSFVKKVEILSKDMYKKIRTFVQENKDTDDKFYENAILKLDDGREVFFNFKNHNIEIRNIKFNEETLSNSGDIFTVRPKIFDFSIGIDYYYTNEKTIHYTISKSLQSSGRYFTEEKEKEILIYISYLYNRLSSLEYDKEKTRAVSNLKPDIKRKYNIQKFNKKMNDLRKSGAEAKALLAVEVAVNWWIKMLKEPELKTVPAFRKTLTSIIMYNLSIGKAVNLENDQFLSEALYEATLEAGINKCQLPVKTHMIIDVDSVKVRSGYGVRYKEIFSNGEAKEIDELITQKKFT